jgi:miniconductance mechanosensitive channel
VNTLLESLSDWWATLPTLTHTLGGLATLLAISIIADLIAKRQLVKLALGVARRTTQKWDDILLQHNVLGRLAQAVPALFIYFGIVLVPDLGDTVTAIIRNVALAYLALMMTLVISATLTAANAIYTEYPIAKNRPIKGYVQVAKIAVYVLGAVIVVSALIDRSPLVLLTGLGAMTAIILLIFKDTILSLVASVQLTSLDMVRVGDWLEMPQYNADGDVIDVALHTVTVQNWDKTITTIPTHRLISESYKNWRAMSESGGRRIKRSIDIDISSVRFLTDNEVQRFETFTLLREYVARKRTELTEYNVALEGPDSAKVNLRRLTNLGTFRAYIWSYLRNHPEIHRDMTLLVRQLQPGDTGIPIEIYCFTSTTEWAAYEDIQADIFDHILAQCGEFDLRVFQALSGADVKTRLAGSSANFGATDP